MPRLSLANLSFALVLACLPMPAFSESTGWLDTEAVEAANFSFIEKWYKPVALAARIQNGIRQYQVEWAKPQGDPFGFRVYPLTSRASAEEMIELHRDPEDLPLSPIDKLCLAKFARAEEGGVEAWIVYLVDPEGSGLRCIRLPDR